MRRTSICGLIGGALLLLGIVCLAQQSSAQLTMTGAGKAGPSGSGVGNLLVFGQSNQQSNTNSATVSYGTLNFGGSSCTRVVMAITATIGGTIAVNSATVGGVSATQVSGTQSTGTGQDVEIWETNSAPSGSSGAVQVVFSAVIPSSGFNGSYVALYCLKTTTPTAHDGENSSQTFGTSVSHNLNVVSGGSCIAAMQSASGGGLALSFASATTDDNNNSNSSIIVGHCTAIGVPLNFVGNSGSGSISMFMGMASWSP